ncbi:hypothetical protein N44_00591 [Microcystis aeruginosa NIES-44]|jgi:hypothetical protein|uniref:Uncharacterized protein n=1 Tax=Microcystis aeruginosa NIES-44 TaxID=449439 RepID=A0A0A1VNL3_MICAE|nr:hypothetical protein N44_00591 [Microcystis aeruginosa NIES-44]
MIKLSRLPIWGKIGLIRNLAALSTFLTIIIQPQLVLGLKLWEQEGDNC